jgi:branched-chain amino acid transport system substrate-binding protein
VHVDGWCSRDASRSGRGLLGQVVCLLLAATACGGATAAAPVPAGGPIPVGLAVAQTGSLAGEGRLTLQGYEMWRDWVNGQGGIRFAGVRHPVQLVVRDDQSRPDVAAGAATQLVVHDGARFLLGPYGSDTSAAVAAVAERYAVPLVAGNAAAQSIFGHGYRYTFGIASLTDQYTVGLLELAVQLSPRPRTIALLSADDQFSQEIDQSARAGAASHGLQVVFSQQYPAGSTDVTALVARFAAAKPDIVLNAGHIAEAVAIHRAAKALALDAMMFAYSVGPSTPEFIAQLGPDADYVFAGVQWTPQLQYRPQMYLTAPEFVAAYRRQFRTLDEPAYQVAQATAAGLALQRAIEMAGSLQAQTVRDALAGLDLTTFYGRVKYDARGANVSKSMVVMQIQHSRRHTVYPPDVADLPPAYPTPAWSVRP